MAPDLSAMRSANAEASASGPNRFVSSSPRSADVSLSSTEDAREMPALLIRMPTSVAKSATSATDTASVTSSWSGITRGSLTSIASGLRVAA